MFVNEMNNLKAALLYVELAYSVIPVGAGPDQKKPLIEWSEYQKRIATEEEIRDWWMHYNNALIGIVCGEVSGIVVLDIDSGADLKRVKEICGRDTQDIPLVITPNNGYHLYFMYSDDIGNARNVLPNVDVRGNGGYVIAPPSMLKDGRAYKWVKGRDLNNLDEPPLPQALVNLIKNNKYSFLNNTSNLLKNNTTNLLKNNTTNLIKNNTSNLINNNINLNMQKNNMLEGTNVEEQKSVPNNVQPIENKEENACPTTCPGGTKAVDRDTAPCPPQRPIGIQQDKRDSAGQMGQVGTDKTTWDKGDNSIQEIDPDDIQIPEGMRDDTIFNRLLLYARAGAPRSALEHEALLLAQNCNPPFPMHEALNKVDAVLKFLQKKNVGITLEIEKFLESHESGYFTVRDVWEIVCEKIPNAKRDYVKRILNRIAHRGDIAPYGNKGGTYIKVDKTKNLLNPFDAVSQDHPVMLPMGLNSLVKIHPKGLIVVAGGSNAGKTAFMLNAVKLNLEVKNPSRIVYFSSELGEEMLRVRIEQMGLLERWREAHDAGYLDFVEWRSNNLNLVEPDAINIIDFISYDLGGEFFQVGLVIGEICKRLNRGVAFVAIQKPPGRSLGYGGDITQHYASLYVALSNASEIEGEVFNVAKIVKGKTWVDKEKNPNNRKMRYTLSEGWKFDLKSNEWK
jgi:hypothetical protein